jgi:hypothetical protein
LILVIGGRSEIGSALLESLPSKGEPMRALVCSGEADGSMTDGVET